MYYIWDTDLYTINNYFWDCRPSKIYQLIQERSYALPIFTSYEEYQKNSLYKIRRIFFDVLRSVTPNMLTTYTSEEWSNLHFAARYLFSDVQNNQNYEFRISHKCICRIIKTAIEYENSAAAAAAPIEFWKFVHLLSRYMHFRLYQSDRYLVIKMLYEKIIETCPRTPGEGARKETGDGVKFVVLITVLYYIYRTWVEKEMDAKITLDKFPQYVLDEINIRTKLTHDTIFEGARLVCLMEHQKKA